MNFSLWIHKSFNDHIFRSTSSSDLNFHFSNQTHSKREPIFDILLEKAKEGVFSHYAISGGNPENLNLEIFLNAKRGLK